MLANRHYNEQPNLEQSVTARNFGAFDVWLDESENAVVHLETGHVDTSVKLSEIGVEDYVIPAGDFDLEIRLFRLVDVLVKGRLRHQSMFRLKRRATTHCGDKTNRMNDCNVPFYAKEII